MSLLSKFYKIALNNYFIENKDKIHYKFLYDFLSSNENYDCDNFDEEFDDFIKYNKLNINKIFKWTLKHPNMLGCGSDGCAFDIGTNKILKLFSNINSFNYAKNNMNDMFKNKNNPESNAMIFDVDYIGDFNAQPVFFYIQEKVNTNYRSINLTLSTIISNIIDEDNLDLSIDESAKNIINNTLKSSSMFEDNFSSILFGIKQINNQAKEKNVFLKNNWEKDFIKDVIANKRKYKNSFDYNSHNLGISESGKILIFDPSIDNGYS